MVLHPYFSWVRERVRECLPCQRFHHQQSTTEFGEWHEAHHLDEVIGIDFMGPFPERKVGKKRFVLVIADRLTGVSGAWACKCAGSREIIVGLNRWVHDRGSPWVLCADVAQATRSHGLKNGTRFGGSLRSFLLHITTLQLCFWNISTKRS